MGANRDEGIVDDVLDYWFGPPDDPDFTTPREKWFKKDAEVDKEITNRFALAQSPAHQ